MDNSDEAWLIELKNILNIRFRTASFESARKRNPLIELPSVIPNTQHLIDGLIWAINDHPQNAAPAWTIVTAQLAERAERVHNFEQGLGAALLNSALVVDQQRYTAYALMQDLYVAFCVMDAYLKNVATLRLELGGGGGAGAGAALKSKVEAEAIKLVGEHLPPLRYYSSYPLRAASREYNLLFLGILHSWSHLRVIDEAARSRLEDVVRHVLKCQRDADDDHGQRAENLMAFRSLSSTGTPRGGSGAAQNGVAGSNKRRTRQSTDKMVSNFVSSIFPARNMMAYRNRCTHCGACLASPEAKEAHFRFHFTNSNLLETDRKIVRLMNPSLENFIAHAGDIDRRGYTPSVLMPFEDANKNGAESFVPTRRLEDIPRVSDRKREHRAW